MIMGDEEIETIPQDESRNSRNEVQWGRTSVNWDKGSLDDEKMSLCLNKFSCSRFWVFSHMKVIDREILFVLKLLYI